MTGTVTDRSIGRRRSDRVVAASNTTQQMLDQAATAARSQLPIVVLGPPGSGKEHTARAIHAMSSRAAGPFITFQVAAVPEALQERELFGGSGRDPASGEDAGLLAQAADGTLLVDGIDHMVDSVRSALVHAIRDGSYRRPGDASASPMRSRVIATAEASDPQLMGDLTVQVIQVPPLANRSEDVLPLAAHFLAMFAGEEGVTPIGFTTDARRWLVDEDWPGNIRELRERIRQAVRLAGNGAVSAEALMLAADGDEVPSFKAAKRAFETRYVECLLRRCGGNISRAARLAKKDRKDFYDVIRRTGVDPTQFRS